jgi:hypothetical protein
VENSNDDITLNGYAEEYNSLGVRTEYRPTKCSLLDVAAVRGNKVLQQCLQTSTQNATTILRLILLGDSNMREQIKWAEGHAVIGAHLPHSFIMAWGGLNPNLPAIQKEIKKILLNDQRQGQYQYVVIFNSGLHDIKFLCKSNRKARGYTARCGDLYRKKLTQLVKLIQQIPSHLTVFQTTTAAWHKWGMFGNYWPAAQKQEMPFTTSFVEYFNEIAWDIMREMKVPIMDTYWLTLSRPDHREVNNLNSINMKMIHAGPQVYSVLVRKWFMMILEAVCPHVVPRSVSLWAKLNLKQPF